MTHNFAVHSNEMTCRKRGRLGLDPVHFYIIWKYYQTSKDMGVLGYTLQDYQCKIPLRIYLMRFPV